LQGVPEYLFMAAAQNVKLHLGKLLKENKVGKWVKVMKAYTDMDQ